MVDASAPGDGVGERAPSGARAVASQSGHPRGCHTARQTSLTQKEQELSRVLAQRKKLSMASAAEQNKVRANAQRRLQEMEKLGALVEQIHAELRRPIARETQVAPPAAPS